MDYEKKYNEALKRARELAAKWTGKNKDFYIGDYSYIFPELSESKDEKSYKRIEQLIRLNTSGAEKTHLLAYLEKQKEPIPYTDFVIKPHKGDDNNPYDMRVSEAQEYAIKRGFGVPFNDGEVYVDERHLTQTIGNILRWADEHPKEQKPLEKQDYSGLNDLEREIHRGFLVAGVENIPVTIIKETAKECLAQINPIVAVDVEQLLKILPQKTAWSEEDEKMRYFVTEAVQSRYSDRELSKYIDPGIIKEKKQLKQRLFDWLRDLRPSWKPTEEQMNALQRAVNKLAKTDVADSVRLSIMYDNLKRN